MNVCILNEQVRDLLQVDSQTYQQNEMLEKAVLYFEQIYSPDALTNMVQHQALADKSYRQDCIPA